MLKFRFVGLIVISLLLVNSAAAREKFFSWDRLTIRESFQNKRDKSDPAFFNIIIPSEGNHFYNLSVAIGYDIVKGKLEKCLEFHPFVEYKRSSKEGGEQNLLLIGGSFDYTTSGVVKHPAAAVILGKLNYKNDKISHSEGIQIRLSATPLFRGKGGNPAYFYIPNNTSKFGEVFRFEYTPHIGLEYENILKSENPEQEGNILRLLMKVRASILLLPKIFKKRIEFSFNYYYRYDLIDEIEENDNRHSFLKASLFFKFFKKGNKAAGFGFDYVYGEDVNKGFQKQDFYQATLKLLL